MSHVSKFEGYKPVDDSTADDYARGDGAGPSEHDGTLYRLFLGEGWRNAAWNQIIVSNMAKIIYADATKEGLTETSITLDVVKATLWDYILQARTSWSAKIPCVLENGERLETANEAKLRNAQYQKKRANAVRLTTRKKMVSEIISRLLSSHWCYRNTKNV